jgi:hypothetical protein
VAFLPLKELRSSSIPRACFHKQPGRGWSQSILLAFNLLSWFCSQTKSFSIFKNSICFYIFVKSLPRAVFQWS